MNKRHLHHTWKFLRKVSYWYFLVLAIAAGVIAVFALRQNNLGAVRLRDHVLQVDKDNGDVEAALRELRTYTYSHMNSSLASTTAAYPPIQLKYRYERLVAAEQQRINEASKGNNTIAEAQAYCERTEPESFFGRGRLPCVQRYIESHPDGQTVTPSTIPDSLYKFDFAAPAWSPDLAGWSLVATGLFGLLFVIRLVLEFWFASLFKHHV